MFVSEQTQRLISIVIVQLLHKCKHPGKRFTRYPSQLFCPLFVLTRGFVEFGIPALIALMSHLNLPFPSYIAFLHSSVPCVLSPFILRINVIWLPSGAREVCVRIRTSHRNRVAMCCGPPPWKSPGSRRLCTVVPYLSHDPGPGLANLCRLYFPCRSVVFDFYTSPFEDKYSTMTATDWVASNPFVLKY